MMPPLSLSSGLFASWALGSNDTSSILGPAVGSKMLTFRSTAIYCALFLMIGALFGGEGPSQTFAAIGSVSNHADVFVIALSTAVSVTLMTLARYPVSTVQAVAGAIIGWSFVSETPISSGALQTAGIVWLASPVLSALLAVCLYKLIAALITALHINIFKLDRMIRSTLFLACAFASYSLGANNIPGTMGVFLPISPFTDLTLLGRVNLSAAHQLYLLGGTITVLGLFTWGRRMAESTGDSIFKFSASPIKALVVVLPQGLVLFLFTSQGVEAFLSGYGLPTLPLIPISGCQSLIGAMIGLTLLKKGFTLSWRSVGSLTSGWLVTPALAFLLTSMTLLIRQSILS